MQMDSIDRSDFDLDDAENDVLIMAKIKLSRLDDQTSNTVFFSSHFLYLKFISAFD